MEDGTIVRSFYDADGVRVRTETTDPSTGDVYTVDFLVDTSNGLSHVVTETDGGTGLLLALYVRGDDLLAVVRPNESRNYHTDGLGSIRALTDEIGTITDQYNFEAFGTLLEHVGDDPNAFLFAGEPLDPYFGFAHHRARWMDPRAGRFVSMDTFPGIYSNPMTLHRYNYSASDPVNSVDPTGLFGVPVMLASLDMFSMMLFSPTVLHPFVASPEGNKKIDVDIRTIVLHGVWEETHVMQVQHDAYSTFMNRARVNLKFLPTERPEGESPNIAKGQALGLIRKYYLQQKKIPLLFAYKHQPAVGIGGNIYNEENPDLSYRGALIDFRATYHPNAAAHELVSRALNSIE